MENLTSPGGGTSDRILPFATTLVAELCADRQIIGATKRPIVFVCHGFGGILVKRALSFSSTRLSKAVEHQRSIYVSTSAIIFMATPHAGIVKDMLLRLNSAANNASPSQLLLSLLKGSEMLQEITDQFAPLMKRFHVYNFWEQKKTYTKGIDSLIVEEESAAPVWDNVERCGIASTHSDMVKFKSSADQGYRVVLEALLRYVNSAPKHIASRWEDDLEYLAAERRIEAESLLRRSAHDVALDTATPGQCNQWSLVPRRSSIFFTGRYAYAATLREKFGPIVRPAGEQSHRIFVIYGLGGSGKTQFCLRYVEDNKNRYVYYVSLDRPVSHGFIDAYIFCQILRRVLDRCQ